jgi:hypothetical protein
MSASAVPVASVTPSACQGLGSLEGASDAARRLRTEKQAGAPGFGARSGSAGASSRPCFPGGERGRGHRADARRSHPGRAVSRLSPCRRHGSPNQFYGTRLRSASTKCLAATLRAAASSRSASERESAALAAGRRPLVRGIGAKRRAAGSRRPRPERALGGHCDLSHDYDPELREWDGGKMDRFVTESIDYERSDDTRSPSTYGHVPAGVTSGVTANGGTTPLRAIPVTRPPTRR